MTIHLDYLISALPILGKGMLWIFLSILVIIAFVSALNKLIPEKQKQIE